MLGGGGGGVASNLQLRLVCPSKPACCATTTIFLIFATQVGLPIQASLLCDHYNLPHLCNSGRALRDEEVGGPPPNCLSWEALAGEEEPGGREEQRIDGEERRVFKKEALRRGTSFKNSYVAWRRLFRK